jgi:hypothetical protein
MPFRDLLNLLRLKPAVHPEERRQTIRLHCRLDVLLWVGDDLHRGVVVDVGLSGLALEVEKALPLGETVSLARDDFGRPWQGEVLWCKARKGARGYRVGVTYPPDEEMLRSSWLQPALKQSGFEVEQSGEKRRTRRVAGRVACQLKGLTGELYSEGEMLDLSLGGALVECDMQFPEGLTLEFETAPLGGLPRLRGLGKVVSCQTNPPTGRWRSGLRFTESKNEDVVKYMSSMLSR